MAHKILVIRFSSIGDIVLTTPVVRSIKKQLPDVSIHYLTKKQFGRLLEVNPFVDRVFTISDKVSEVLHELKQQQYTHIVDLHKNLRSAQVVRSLHMPHSSFDKLNLQKWLLVNMKINRMPALHIVERYMQAVKKLGVINDGEGLNFFIAPGDEVGVQVLPESFQNGFAAIVIGGKHQTKIFPASKVIDLCRQLNRPVVLFGGPEDAPLGREISEAAGELVYNSCGKFNLMQSASLLHKSSVVITNDTGLMHIAAAFRLPVVSVWGNTVPQLGMTPYMPGSSDQQIAEVPGLNCRPCSKIGFESCPKGHFRCMMDQDTGAIAEFARRYI